MTSSAVRRVRGPMDASVFNGALPLAAALAVLTLAWQRYWTSDDGLIAVRVAEQIADGHGPVINAGERVEASTSALWPWLLAALAWIPVDLTWVAVIAGALLSALAVVVAIRACMHLQPGDGIWVPAGLLVVVAVPAFWDFFTSGLETGLAFLWLSLAWRSLIRRLHGSDRAWLDALVLGLGPVVRPELFIVTVCYSLSGVAFARRRPRLLSWASLVLAPGVLYEFFRATYFGVLVPNPAIAKEAGRAYWSQGWWYLGDFIVSYQLWLPIGLLTLVVGARWGRLDGVATVAIGSPVVAALAMGAYITRLGGDFMHARLLLPSLFCLLLPVLVWPMPSSRRSAAGILVLGVWAFTCPIALGPAYSGTETFHNIVDERSQLVALRGMSHVVTGNEHFKSNSRLVAAARRASESGGISYVPYWGWRDQVYLTIPSADRSEGVIAAHALGVTSMAAARFGLKAHDLLGLADPITAHYQLPIPRGRPGHEKWLPDAWLVARYSGSATVEGETSGDVQHASRALACGPLAELDRSYRDPLTWSRGWQNLAGAYSRTFLRYSPDPELASESLC